jgi:OOP family OmpA-OmpF porin
MKRAAVLAVLVWCSPLSSQAGRGGIDVEQFRPQVDGRGLFSAEGAETHHTLQWGLGLVLHYSKSPLVAIEGANRAKLGDLVSDRFTADLVFSLGLQRWLTLGIGLPLALANEQDAFLQGGSGVTGLGSLRLQLKFRLLSEGHHGLGLAFLPVVYLPTGNHNAFLGQNGVVFSPMLVLERRLGLARLLFNFGYTVRERTSFLNLAVDDELFWRIGLSLRVHERVELGGELIGSTAAGAPFDTDVRYNPLEAIFGARFFASDRLQVQVGAGPGLTKGYGTPLFRLFAGLVFAPHELDTDGDGIPDRRDRCPTEPGPPQYYGCPLKDTDGDGLPDNMDECPTVPGPRENRGCPWPDTDRDGVPDKLDKCPTVPGPRENQGCPWPDTDGDGIPDKDDRCPAVPGPRENQGCPWPDTDGDGVLDKDDRCPKVPGPRENEGCPWPDTDGDGVLDKDDRCSAVPGPRENQGCPWPDTDGDGIPDKDDDCPKEPGPRHNRGCPLKAVVVTRTEVKISSQIFFRTGSATIRRKSYGILRDVADALKRHPEIQVEVQGHTDDVGGAKMNLRLSQRRAESVRKFLLKQGVGPARMTSKGYGLTAPLRPVTKGMGKKQVNEARALNRRVQFIITKQ